MPGGCPAEAGYEEASYTEMNGGNGEMKVVVTGANRGLGYELVKKFASEGHHVAACYFPKAPKDELDELAAGYNSLVTLVPMDVTSEKDVMLAAETVRNVFSQVDAVISNAGVLCDGDRTNDLLQMDLEDLRVSMDVNLVGPAMVIRYFTPFVKRSNDSVFITVTSEAGSIRNTGSGFPAYSISKAAANKLVAVFRSTVPDIRIFAVHPGRMNTVMGRTTAQIEAWESAEGLYGIVTGGHRDIPQDIWFIDYKGQPMEL